MQVKEPEYLSSRAERDAFGQPDEPHTLARPALRGMSHDLAEREERLGHLQDDPLRVELGPRRQVRTFAVAQRLHVDLVAARLRQPDEGASNPLRRKLGDVGSDAHRRKATPLDSIRRQEAWD